MGSGSSRSASPLPSPAQSPAKLCPGAFEPNKRPSPLAQDPSATGSEPVPRNEEEAKEDGSFSVKRSESQYVVEFNPEELKPEEKELVEAAASASFSKRHARGVPSDEPSPRQQQKRERRLTVENIPIPAAVLRDPIDGGGEAAAAAVTAAVHSGAAAAEPEPPPGADRQMATEAKPRPPRKSVSFDLTAEQQQPPPEERAQEHAPENKSPFRPERVGMYSKRGAKADEDGNSTVKINQDRGCACSRHHDGVNVAMFCVFDGHGPEGEIVSEYVMTRMQEKLLSHADVVASTEHAIADALVDVDEELMADDAVASLRSGTTAAVVVLCKNQLWVGNVGDSRTVLGSQNRDGDIVATDLSADHKPDYGEEFDRIIAAGGLVSEATERDGPARVWFAPNQETGLSSGPGLAMSRSVGDHAARGIGVIAEPEVRRHKLCKADKMLIVASDGVWEVLSSQEAVDLVSEHENATTACRRLVRESVTRWAEAEGDEYRDDITAIVVFM